jgi:ethanolamine ammonia-lyase small subunit
MTETWFSEARMSDSAQIRGPRPNAETAQVLRDYTPARVALGRTGASLATRHALEFALAHAQARDAVHSSLGVPSLLAGLRERGLASIAVKSAAASRTEYLRRPDLGRTLSHASATQLATASGGPSTEPGAPSMQSHRMGGLSPADAHDRPSLGQPSRVNLQRAALSIILADGLSSLATDRHALAVLDALLPLLEIGEPGVSWQLTPIAVAEQARVALGDEIGSMLDADLTLMLIGERPGLSSPDSLGAYITWAPQPGRTDAERNCVSNIRVEGLDYATAASKIAWYIGEGRRLGLNGVAIREADTHVLPDGPTARGAVTS